MVELANIGAQAAGLLFVHALVWFGISLAFKRNDVADLGWGLGFCLLAGWFLLTLPMTPLAGWVYGLTIVWGLRLFWHLYFRNRHKGEDFRYRQWREAWGSSFYWRSFLQVYLLQSFFLWLISWPLIWVARWPGELNLIFWMGLVIWVAGFFFEAVGDYQLTRFLTVRKSGELMQRGLWKYSRHPNYFGEIVLWWGMFLMVVSLPNGWIAIVSPLTITGLLVFVSGVPMLEKKYQGNQKYREYAKRTPALFPKFW